MRAVAITLVLISYGTRNADRFGATGMGRFVDTFGHLGVDIFFVLSGFLITTLLLHELAGKGASISQISTLVGCGASSRRIGYS